MSLATLIGLGYSGYAILNDIPLLLLPSGITEDEHLIKSEGSFHPNPAFNTGQLPARQRRSLNISFSTVVTPRTLPLLKALTYEWRSLVSVGSIPKIDAVPEVLFTYVVGVGEGFEGKAHIDDVTLSAAPENLLTMAINLTSWVWTELDSPAPLSRMGTPILTDLLLDPMNKPIAGWNGAVITPVISANAIVQRYSLRLANNWTYQAFLAGYSKPPNPAVIAAGNLDVALDITWVACRSDRPKNSGSFEIRIGGDDPAAHPANALNTIYLDNMIREPRGFQGGGSPNDVIQWNSTYFLKGNIPRSTL